MSKPSLPPPSKLLLSAQEPESDDPTQWTPPEVLGLALMYAYGVEALPQQGQAGWTEAHHLCDDLLFNRDRLQDWLDLYGEDAIERLIKTEAPHLPLPSQSDARLALLYCEDISARTAIDREYTSFRDEIAPPRHHRWWWLDAERLERGVH